MKWIVAAVVAVAALAFGIRYWRDASLYVSTDNAYVQASQVEITPQVTGPVTAVHVNDQQAVKAGDPLFDIDARNYEIALGKASAQLERARQSASRESAGIASAQALLTKRRAEAANASANWKRNQELIKSGFLSPRAPRRP